VSSRPSRRSSRQTGGAPPGVSRVLGDMSSRRRRRLCCVQIKSCLFLFAVVLAAAAVVVLSNLAGRRRRERVSLSTVGLLSPQAESPH
jgi:hypothetical protein